MVKSTIIARVADGLPLAASMDDEEAEDLADYKSQAKLIFKRLTPQSDPKCSIETGPYVFHYLIERGICYLCLSERSYPKKLAFAYLEELEKEFGEKYGSEVGGVARPYAFVKFGRYRNEHRYLAGTAWLAGNWIYVEDAVEPCKNAF